MTNYKPTLQECAMRYGTGMGLLWAFKFMLFPLGLRIPFLQLLFIVLTIGVPFLGYIFAKKFRERHCGGSITFSRAFLFTLYVYVRLSVCCGTLHLLQVHRPRICDKHVRNDGRHACPKQHAGNGFVHRHLSGSSGDSPTAQSYRHYTTDDIVQCVLGFDTGFPHRLVRDETQERQRSGKVTEQ